MGDVITKTFPAPPINRTAVLRYCRATEFTAETEELYEKCLAEGLPRSFYRLCYCELPLRFAEGKVLLGDIRITSGDLEKRLKDCHAAVIFAATVGLEYDRLISVYGRLDRAKAFMFQAIGTERVEALCDAFCLELAEEKKLLGEETTPRFSPGYGDLPLETQKDVFAVLDCGKRIGVYLNEILLMTPSKSVTAIIGIKKKSV